MSMSESQVSPTSTPSPAPPALPPRPTVLDRAIRFCLENRLVVVLVVLAVTTWGALVAPFDWQIGGLPRDPVPTDAIPDIGDNQQIVFTEWMGRSPRDVEDQITYPLTVALLGTPGVKTIRSYSFFGFSSIYIIFDEKTEFYWSRSRVLEKLNSLGADTLPEGVRPSLGPDATALGQVYWYTLEGRDPDGDPAVGWDSVELRTVQDWYVRYALQSAEGISEVSSIGGFVREYQIDVDPDAMRAFNVTLDEIFGAVRMSNVDVGARTIEINKVEYVIRGLGFLESVEDIEQSVIKQSENVPVRIGDVATVSLGPALRRGGLDKAGADAVGGVAVVRFGYNPMAAINNIKAKLDEIKTGLPIRAVIDHDRVDRDRVESFAGSRGFEAYRVGGLNQEGWMAYLNATPRPDWPEWVTTSRVTVVPFYDRSGLIDETLGTLNSALTEEILVTIIVVIVMVMHLRSSLLIGVLLPLAVLICFIAMKTFGVDANVVALSGIAIAIGTMVDMGIIVCENILKHLDESDPSESRLEVIYRASSEVASAVLTAVATTIISFLPVFTMIGAEGKLFRPLAFTKTFALLASVVVALAIIPPAALVLFRGPRKAGKFRFMLSLALIAGGAAVWLLLSRWAGAILAALGVYRLVENRLPAAARRAAIWLVNGLAVAVVGVVLARHWEPLGVEQGTVRNLLFVGGLIGGLLGCFLLFQWVIYRPLLRWCLDHKLLFLSAPMAIVVLGGAAWLGFDRVFGFVPWAVEKAGGDPDQVRLSRPWSAMSRTFPGLGREFMPRLDEGAFLWMPTTMPHASIGEAMDVLRLQDMAINAIPEVEMVVGKIGRVDSPLDPAPVSMVETIVRYKSEYVTDEHGDRINYRFDEGTKTFERDDRGELVPDPDGRPFRQWREEVRSTDDIWDAIVEAGTIVGSTSAPKLQPIETRLIMLQTGMRAPMGLKVRGPDLETIERVAQDLERLLKQVPSVEPSAVIADRVVGKPYLEIDIDREAIGRYGLMIRQVQDVIEVAIGGRRVTTTVEGRERYPVRVRYLRELRDQIETLGRILVAAPDGTQVPLGQLAEIRYVRGPQAIKSEDTFLVAYVLLDKKAGFAEVDVVEDCQRFLDRKIKSGELVLPAGVSYRFSGSYENQIRAQKTLSVVLPLALFLIFLILYFQFKQVPTTLLVFSGIVVAWAGGFLMIWAYGQGWFLNFEVFGTNMRTLFSVHPINLSVAIWVGFLALFGIASDDGVVIATYLDQSFAANPVATVEDARAAALEAGLRRVRPCLMTTATTILALIPVLTSTGRGSDIMVPMAIPSFGGMLIEVLTMLVVPVLYCAIKEFKINVGLRDRLLDIEADAVNAGPSDSPASGLANR